MADEDNTGAEPSWFDPMHCGGRVEPDGETYFAGSGLTINMRLM